MSERQAGASDGDDKLVRRVAHELRLWESGESDELYTDFAKRLVAIIASAQK